MFLLIISSLPTVIFTFVLALMLCLWLVTLLGLFDIDVFGIDVPDVGGELGFLSGWLHKLSLNGVPFTIILSFISLIGWMISYTFTRFLILPVDNPLVKFIIGVVVFFITLFLSVLITAQIIKPLRRFFGNSFTTDYSRIIGRVLTVRTSRVDETFGQATLQDGGAGLILKVRALDGETYNKGDKVIAFEYLKEKNIYRVMSESAFLGKHQ